MLEGQLDSLERRIITLEQNVFNNKTEYGDNKPIIDSFIQSHIITSSALSGREKLSAIVKRLDHLEEVLDPLYEDIVLDTLAKTEFILSMEDELRKVIELLKNVNELLPVLENDQFKNIPNLTKQLSHLTMLTLETKSTVDLQSKTINNLISKYTEILNGLTALFASLERQVTQLEIKSQPQKLGK